MRPPIIRLLLMLLSFGLLAPGMARAEFVDFSYHWEASPGSVISQGSSSSILLAIAPDGTATAEMASPGVMVVPTPIPGALVTTNSSATDPADSFNAAYAMKLTLTDTSSGMMEELSFSGHITGSLSVNGSTLVSTFAEPLTRSVTLGSHVYTVTIDPTVLNLPAPTSTAPVLIDALVSVSPVASTPEPSSLLLGALAVGGFVGRRYVRRRTTK